MRVCARSSASSTALSLPQRHYDRPVADVLIFADTVRSPQLRHEVPLAAPDPFIYAEREGGRYVFAGSMEVPRLAELDGLQPVPLEELGVDELIEQGLAWHDRDRELT